MRRSRGRPRDAKSVRERSSGESSATRLAALAIVVATQVGCITTPAPGEPMVVEVRRVPLTRVALQFSPGLRLAIARGVTREDAVAGRLAIASCRVGPTALHPQGEWRHGHVLLPPGMKGAKGATIVVAAEQADDTGGPYARYFGRFLRVVEVAPVDYLTDRVTGRSLRCWPLAASGELRVEIHGTVGRSDYDFAAAEAARHAQLADEEIHGGRIAVAQCSIGALSWAEWLVRLPAGMTATAGEFLEVVAGDAELTLGRGPVSRAIRRIGRPAADGFRHFHGADMVRCDARADAPALR